MAIMVGSSSCIFAINSGVILNSGYLCGEFMLWTVFLAVVGTTIPTALFAAGISKIGAGISSILMTVELPVAILCVRIVLKEYISLLQATGILVMLASIAAMNYYKVSDCSCTICSRRFLFFILCGDRLLYSKDFCHTIGISRVSFAPAELLHDMLGTNIGAATVLSI